MVGVETSVGGVARAAGTPAGRDTRRRIVDAVVETLRTEGVAGASARTIARVGGFNQALIFYHFGSVAGALLAAVDDTTTRRLPAYRAALAGATTPEEVATAVRPLLAEDLDGGHLPALAALVAGGARSPALRTGIGDRLAPWLALVEEVTARVAPDRVRPTDVAVTAVATGLGLGLLARLSDAPGADALAAMAARLLAPSPPG